MKTKSFLVSGVIKRKMQRRFSMEVEANSEKHARTLAIVKLGSKHGLKPTAYEINEVKKK